MNETWMTTKVKASIGGKQEEINKNFLMFKYNLNVKKAQYDLNAFGIA